MANRTLESMQIEVCNLIDAWCERCELRPLSIMVEFHRGLLRTAHSDGLCDFYDAVSQTLHECELLECERRQLEKLAFATDDRVEFSQQRSAPLLWGDYAQSAIDPYQAIVELLNHLCQRHELLRLGELLPAWFANRGGRLELRTLRDRIAKYGQGVTSDLDRLAMQIINTLDGLLEPRSKSVDLEGILDALFAPHD